MESGQAVNTLGLETALSSEIALVDLPPYAPADDIPLDDLERRLPGRFDLCEDLLRWLPPAGLDTANVRLEFFDQVGDELACRLEQIGMEKGALLFRFVSQELPHFARFRTYGTESSLGIVVVEQAIHDAQRRAKTKGVENALALLEDEEAFEGLWLLEVIQKLDAAEQVSRAPGGQGRVQHRREKDLHKQGSSEVLTYEQFIAGRKVAGATSQPAGSHLAATHHESIRGFLNALIGSRNGQIFAVDDDAEPEQPRFSLGDETADGESALEQDARFASDEQQTIAARVPVEQRLRRRWWDTQRSIVNAVDRFIATLHEEALQRPLGVVDLLRLRVLLMVVLGAGSKRSFLQPVESNGVVSLREVLPSRGEASWRRLVGRLLFEFFRKPGGSKVPLINKIVLDVDGASALPADVVECWATCYWAACASRVAVDEDNVPYKPSVAELRIAPDLYASTRLLPNELLGDLVKKVFDGACDRYGERLGVSTTDVVREHERLVAAYRTGSCAPLVPSSATGLN